MKLQYNNPFYQPFEILESNGIFTTVDQTGGAHLFGHLFKTDVNFGFYTSRFITPPSANGYNRYAMETFKDILLHLDKNYKLNGDGEPIYYNYEKAKKAFKEIYGVKKNAKRYEEVAALINTRQPLSNNQADEIIKEMMGLAQNEFLKKGFNGISYETDMNFFEGRLYQDSLSNRIGQMKTVARKIDVSEPLAIAQTHINRMPGMHYFKGSDIDTHKTKPSVIGFFNGSENYYKTFGTNPFQVIGAAPNAYGGYNLVNLDVRYVENKLENPNLIVTSMQDTGIRMPSAFSSSTFGEYKMVSQQGMRKTYQSGAESLIWRSINQVVYDTSIGMNNTIDQKAYEPIHAAIQKTHLSTTPNYLTELSNMGTFLFSNGLKEDSVRDQLDLITLSSSQYKGILGQFYDQEGKYNKFIKNVQEITGMQDFDFSFQVGFGTDNKIKSVTPIFLDRNNDTIMYGFEGLETQFGIKKDVIANAKKGLNSTFNDLTDGFKGIFDRSDLVMFQGEQDSKFFRRLTMFDDNGNNLMKQWNDRVSNIFDSVTKSNYYENKKFTSDAEQIRYLVSQTEEFKSVVNDISENVAKNSIQILGLDEMRFQRNNLFHQYRAFQNGEISAIDYLKNARKMINIGLGDSDYISGIQGRIEEALELANPTRIASFLSSGNMIENLNMVAKQSSNINAKKSAFLGHTSMLSYLNIENQRHAQTDDRLTPFTIGGETIGQMVSQYTRHVPGLEATGYSMVNESSVRLGEEIFKIAKVEQFGNEKSLIEQVNHFEIPRTFQSNRGMVLIADTEIAWQDSNRFSNKAILETIGMSDKIKEITISGNNNPDAQGFIDFTKIKKFGSEDEYYSADFDFFKIAKRRSTSNINVYNPNTEEGYIIQQILGEKNYERMIRGNNPENLRADLQQALSPLTTLKASTVENVDYNAKIYDTTLSNVKNVLLENTVAGDHLKRANPFSDLVQVANEGLNSSDYYLPIGMKVTPEGFTFQFRPLTTAGIGSKLITNPQKATVGGINPIIGLVNKETGNILNVDMVANLKMGHEKRGFNGALFSNMFQGMYSYIATAPLQNELLDGETYDTLSPQRMAEIQQSRINKFTEALHQKDMRLSKDGASVFDIFDIDVKTSVNANGQVELGFRDMHYEKALDRYMDMYNSTTASIEHMAIEEMYRKARLNGIRLTDDNIRAFGETLKTSMIETYWDFLKGNYTLEQASDMKMFYNLADDDLELAVSAQGANGLFEMIGVKTNSDWVMLFPSFINNMKDSTAQKKTGAMKFGWLTSVVQAENGLDVFNAIHFGEATRINQKELNLKKALFGAAGFEKFSDKYIELFGEGIRIADVAEGSIEKIPSYITSTNLLNTSSYGFQLKKVNDRIAPLQTHLDFRGYHGLDFLFTLGQDDKEMSTVKNYGFFSILNEKLEKPKAKVNKKMIFNRVSGLKTTEETSFLHKVASENILSFTTDEVEILRSDFTNIEDNLSSMVEKRLSRYEEILKHSNSEGIRGLSTKIKNSEDLSSYVKNTLLVDLYFKTANDHSSNKLTPHHLSAATDFLLSSDNDKTKIKGAVERGIKKAQGEGNAQAAMLFRFMNSFRIDGEQGSLDNIEYILDSIGQGSMAVSTGAISVDDAGMIVHNKSLTAVNNTLFYLSKMKEFEANREQVSKIVNSGLFEEIEDATGHNYGVFKYIGQTRKTLNKEKQIEAQRTVLKNMLFHRINEINDKERYVSKARSEEFGQFLLDTFEYYNTHTTYDARSLGQGKINTSSGKIAMDDGIITALFGHKYMEDGVLVSEFNKETKRLNTDPIRVLAELRKMIDEGSNIKSKEQHAIQAQARKAYKIIENHFISQMDDFGVYFDYSLEDLNTSGLSASDMREGLADAYTKMLLWFGSGIMQNEKGWLQAFNNGLLTKTGKFQEHFLNSLVKLTETNLEAHGTTKKALTELLSYSIPNSMSVEPSDGTSLLYGIQNYISNGITSKGKVGYNQIDSLFISNGKFKNPKQLKQDYNDFLKLMNKTFGSVLDLGGKELLAEEFQEIYRDVQNGKITMEEFESRIATFRSHLDYRMEAIDGIAFSSEQMFKDMGASREFGKDGYTHGFLHRNPDQYLFSTKANRIVQYTEEEIAKYPFLNSVLGEGRGLINTQHMFLVGFDNFLASNGDFDGDNAYLLFASLSKDTQLDARKAKALMKKEAQINSEFTNLMKKYRVRKDGGKVLNYENLAKAYDSVISGDQNDSLITSIRDSIRKLEQMKGRNVTDAEIKEIMEQKFARYHFEMKRISKELNKELKTHDSVIGARTILKTTVNGHGYSLNSDTVSTLLMTGDRSDIDTIFTGDTLQKDKERIQESFKKLINDFLAKNEEWKQKGYKGPVSDKEIEKLQSLVAGDQDTNDSVEAFRNIFQEFKENKHIASLEANWLGQAGKYKDLVGLSKTGIVHSELTSYRSFASYLADTTTATAFWKANDELLYNYFENPAKFAEFRQSVETLTHNNIFGVLIEEGAISSKKGAGSTTTAAFLGPYRDVYNKIMMNKGEGGPTEGTIFLNQKGMRDLSKKIYKSSITGKLNEFGDMTLAEYLVKIGMNAEEDTDISKIDNIMDIISSVDRKTGNKMIDGAKKFYSYKRKSFTEENTAAINSLLSKTAKKLGMDIKDNGILGVTLKDLGKLTGMNDDEIIQRLSNYNSVVIKGIFSNQIYNGDRHVADGVYSEAKKFPKSIPKLLKAMNPFEAKNKGGLDPRFSGTSNLVTLEEVAKEVASGSINKDTIDAIRFEEMASRIAPEVKEETVNAATEATEKVQKVVENINKNSTASKVIEEVTTNKSSSETAENMQKAAEAAQSTAQSMKKNVKNLSDRYGMAATLGFGAVVLGGFFKLINQNRTVIDLDLQEQQMEKEKGSLYRNLGQYHINTNIRDFY